MVTRIVRLKSRCRGRRTLNKCTLLTAASATFANPDECWMEMQIHALYIRTPR